MRKIIAFILLLGSILIFPIQTFAVEYKIEKVKIDAFLQEDGKVEVTEEHTYNFDGDFNGITRTLYPKKGTLITDLEATENDDPLHVEQDDSLYKIFRKGESETVTVELTYTIEYGIEAYADVVQFYWPFFDRRNKSTYEQLDVFIHPPSPTNDVIAFGYDEAEETEKILHNGVVHFAMGKVPRITNGDIRVAYDVNLFPTIMHHENKQMRNEIIAAKKELTDKRIQFERNKQIMRTIAPYVIGLFALYISCIFLYAWRKKHQTKREVERQYDLPYFIPEAEMSLPATIVYTNRGKFNAETITAALLDLIRKGNIRHKDEDNFILDNIRTEHEHERLLIRWLFYEIGHNGRFELTDLKEYIDKKSNRSDYASSFKKWSDSIKEEIDLHKLKDKSKKRIWIIFAISLPFVPFTIKCFTYNLFGYMSLSLFLFFILLIFLFKFHPRTKQGAKVKREWMAFQQKYIDMDEDVWMEIVEDEQKRAFVYGAGIKNKQIKKKNEAILDHIDAPLQIGVSSFSLLFIAVNTYAYFIHANRFMFYYRGTSSGGGGAGGVGGGGGGSGAF